MSKPHYHIKVNRKRKPAKLLPETIVAHDQLLNYLFIVYAHAGRCNGWALVTANDKTEARQFARQSDWLSTGTVDGAVTLSEYLEEMGDDIETGFNEYIQDFPENNKIGTVSEIDWGT